MKRNGTILVLVFFLFALSGCFKKEPKDKHEFIERVEVEGVCYEDHVKEKGSYSGNFVHWYNNTKGTHSRYGSIFLKDRMSAEMMQENIMNPHKYFLPNIISFDSIPQSVFSQAKMDIKGLSDSGGKKYEATCELAVTKRLDHIPHTTAIGKEGNE